MSELVRYRAVRSIEAPAGALERLFREQYAALLGFFRRRIRSADDSADLAQEVYARMLRIEDPQAIRNPQAYLFAVAGNLVKEQALLDSRRALFIDIDTVSGEQLLRELPNFEGDCDRQQRTVRLREVLDQLPPKCRAVVLLHYHEGLGNQEIAERLGLSIHMVKKYIGQALLHCRKRMRRLA